MWELCLIVIRDGQAVVHYERVTLGGRGVFRNSEKASRGHHPAVSTEAVLERRKEKTLKS